MFPQLTPIDRCREVAGLGPHEMLLGVSPARKHERLLARYSRARSLPAARVRIVADMRVALKGGALGEAADLLVVLRRLLARDASPAEAQPHARRRITSPRGRQGWGRPLTPQVFDGEAGQVLQWRRPGKGAAESVV